MTKKKQDKMPTMRELLEGDLASHGFRIKPGGQTRTYGREGPPPSDGGKIKVNAIKWMAGNLHAQPVAARKPFTSEEASDGKKCGLELDGEFAIGPREAFQKYFQNYQGMDPEEIDKMMKDIEPA